MDERVDAGWSGRPPVARSSAVPQGSVHWSPAPALGAPAPRASGLAWAGFWRRLFAMVVDSLLLFVIGEMLAAIGFPLSTTTFDPAAEGGRAIEYVASAIIAAAYFIGFHSRGATPGKIVLGITVVNADGAAPGLRRASLRYAIPALGAISGFGLTVPSDDRFGAILVAFGLGVSLSLVVVVDGLSMLWNDRRQTFHDRMAGTYVVRRVPSGTTPYQPGIGEQTLPAGHRKPHWLVTPATIIVALVVGLVIVAYVAVQRGIDAFETNVVEVMTDTLRASSAEVVGARADGANAVHFPEDSITVNNAYETGAAGWEVGTDGTFVFGMEIRFDDDALVLTLGPDPMYSGVPVVRDGRIELTQVRTIDNDVVRSVLDAEDFESVIETGLNDALAEHGLVPTDIRIQDDALSVQVVPASEPG